MTGYRRGHPSHRTLLIATNVKQLRKARRMTLEEAAQAVKQTGVPMSRSMLVNIEVGRRDNVTVDELFALAEVLGSTIEYIAGGVGVACTHCQDDPPNGFTCNHCRRTGQED
jgi:transcriptional regulator with XRE-family HTH domain